MQKYTSVRFLEIPQLKEFSAYTITQELTENFSDVKNISWNELQLNRTAPLASLLTLMEERENFEKLKKFLSAQKGNSSVIFMPPVLGVKNYLDYHAELEKDLGVRIVELLSVLPSTSGLRLTQHVRDFFKNNTSNNNLSNILDEPHWIESEVCGFEKSHDTITSLILKNNFKNKNEVPEKINPKLVVLATGKYIGGGILREEFFHESIFDLPLVAQGRAVTKNQHVTQLINPKALERQDFLDVGLQINYAGVPLDGLNTVFKNLRACGQVLSGFDFTRDRCGFGVSLASAQLF